MSERAFLFLVGAFILASLYVEVDLMIYGLCLLLFFETLTDYRLTTLTQRLFHREMGPGLVIFQNVQRINFDAFRAWRLIVAIMLGGSMLLINEKNIEVLWFFPWFMGFAILGAGVSGVCPVLLFVKWIGFK